MVRFHLKKSENVLLIDPLARRQHRVHFFDDVTCANNVRLLTLNACLLCKAVDHENFALAVRLDVKLVGCDVSAKKTKKIKNFIDFVFTLQRTHYEHWLATLTSSYHRGHPLHYFKKTITPLNLLKSFGGL